MEISWNFPGTVVESKQNLVNIYFSQLSTLVNDQQELGR